MLNISNQNGLRCFLYENLREFSLQKRAFPYKILKAYQCARQNGHRNKARNVLLKGVLMKDGVFLLE